MSQFNTPYGTSLHRARESERLLGADDQSRLSNNLYGTSSQSERESEPLWEEDNEIHLPDGDKKPGNFILKKTVDDLAKIFENDPRTTDILRAEFNKIHEHLKTMEKEMSKGSMVLANISQCSTRRRLRGMKEEGPKELISLAKKFDLKLKAFIEKVKTENNNSALAQQGVQLLDHSGKFQEECVEVIDEFRGLSDQAWKEAIAHLKLILKLVRLIGTVVGLAIGFWKGK